MRKLIRTCQSDDTVNEMARIKWLWRDKLTDVQRTELFTWIKDLATPTPSLPKPVAALSDEQQPAFPAAVEPFSTRPVRDLSYALSGPFGGPEPQARRT